MGCWNKTCGLSRLHITVGTPVYVFVMEEAKNNRNRCYTTSLYAPLILPFEAEYNDYGGGEHETGVALPYILNAIAKNLIEAEQEEVPVKQEDFNAEIFFETAHNGSLKIKDKQGRPRNVEFVMIRKDVVQNILNTWVREYYVGDGKGTAGNGNNYIHYKFEDVLADVDAFLQLLKEIISQDVKEVNAQGDNITPEQISAIKKALWRTLYLTGIADAVAEYSPNNKVSWCLSSDRTRYSSLVNPSEIILEALDNNNFKLARELLITYLIGSYIDEFYDHTRNIWTPGCHEGSPAQEEDAYRVLATTLIKILDKH